MIRRVDPSRPRGPLYRAYAWFSGSRGGIWFARVVSWRIDPILLRLTGGRIGTAAIIATAVLETTGARSGKTRRNALIYFHDGGDEIIVASKAGAPEHPSWFHNLRSNPEVRFGGEPRRAVIVTDPAETARLFALADNVFPPFARYCERAGRDIPVVRLCQASGPAAHS
jgi:deazaflavin-dependent oxidoreductase (nitroreductase family)